MPFNGFISALAGERETGVRILMLNESEVTSVICEARDKGA